MSSLVFLLKSRVLSYIFSMPSVSYEPYLLPGYKDLALGFQIPSSATAKMNNAQQTAIQRQQCHPSPGIYTARDLVKVTSPLLNSIVHALGEDTDGEPSSKDVLVDGLAASLAVTGRESTLPLSYGKSDTSRREIANQAQVIGDTLVEYARSTPKGDEADQNVRLYSQCEGHLWTPAVAALLLGPRSNAQLMQLYNEWLHRMILLRDALLPFENFDQVPLVLSSSNKQGIRDFEEPRKNFLLQCLTGRISQAEIVDVAKVFTTRSLGSGGYAFQYSQGLVMPAFLSSSSSLHLLRHHPARIDDSQVDILFDYEYPVYFDAERNELPKAEESLPPGQWPPPSLLALEPQVTKSSIGVRTAKDPTRRVMNIELGLGNGESITVDVGQIGRGIRYAYRAASAGNPGKKRNLEQSLVEEPISGKTKKTNITALHIHSAGDILRAPGLITPDIKSRSNELHLFWAKDPLIRLALLGKLYPENVILLDEDDDPEKALHVGKGFGGRVVVVQNKRRKIATVDDA
ncbi:hypothetical protein BHE90_014456 [Fusarium euwallaceae]|uniref:Uncharacterized protein n=1 Tax=Fusarium euwallaceae TaxID=1147111 RepID=A0A430L5Y0_9HYPO|nr:hypothetical protein BHE90_014456 [Fusarium euwallaceae]